MASPFGSYEDLLKLGVTDSELAKAGYPNFSQGSQGVQQTSYPLRPVGQPSALQTPPKGRNLPAIKSGARGVQVIPKGASIPPVVNVNPVATSIPQGMNLPATIPQQPTIGTGTSTVGGKPYVSFGSKAGNFVSKGKDFARGAVGPALAVSAIEYGAARPTAKVKEQEYVPTVGHFNRETSDLPPWSGENRIALPEAYDQSTIATHATNPYSGDPIMTGRVIKQAPSLSPTPIAPINIPKGGDLPLFAQPEATKPPAPDVAPQAAVSPAILNKPAIQPLREMTAQESWDSRNIDPRTAMKHADDDLASQGVLWTDRRTPEMLAIKQGMADKEMQAQNSTRAGIENRIKNEQMIPDEALKNRGLMYVGEQAHAGTGEVNKSNADYNKARSRAAILTALAKTEGQEGDKGLTRNQYYTQLNAAIKAGMPEDKLALLKKQLDKELTVAEKFHKPDYTTQEQ